MFTYRSEFTLLFSILIISLTTSATSKPAVDGVAYDNIIEINMLTAFVDEAAAYVKDNGKEKALLEFNNRTGSFVRGEQYIYAHDYNGTNLAHPIRPDLIGNDQRGLLDINGVAMIRKELAWLKWGAGSCIWCSKIPSMKTEKS
jgi:signal transduction histidine kinase